MNYQIDKFDLVVEQMEALVVSLDRDMSSIKRVWVVAEIGKALLTCPVFFRMAMGLREDGVQKLAQQKPLMETVEMCEATSPADRERIVAQIQAMPGGTVAYDDFINTMLDISFGSCHSLPKQKAKERTRLETFRV